MRLLHLIVILKFFKLQSINYSFEMYSNLVKGNYCSSINYIIHLNYLTNENLKFFKVSNF